VFKPCLLIAVLLSCAFSFAQLPVTLPWSSTVYQTFPNASPLPVDKSDFSYTPASAPAAGSYSVIYSTNDAGHLFFGPFTQPVIVDGYKMIATYNAATSGKALYRDTVRNLCGNSRYMFWAGVNNVFPGGCLQPNLSFNVETLTGTIIQSFQTGNIGGPLAGDHYSWPPGYYDPTRRPKVPFYGGSFQLPAGVTDIVLKIVTNPSTAPSQCYAFLELDNIILMPTGPDIRITSDKYPGGYIAASCFQGNVPLVLKGKIEPGYLELGTPNYILQNYTNPAFQWQQSLDEGYTWTDIAGETNINISHVFNISDTFWVRLLVSEINDIGNRNCSNASNVMKIQVEKPPADFSITSNSPVCTDGDLKLTVSGGATYNTYGPNGFSDDSPFPHIYHPDLADSGWYYTEVYSFGGCKAVDSVFVKVIGPNISSASADRTICYGDTVHLFATGGVSYSWTPAEGLSNATIGNPISSPVKTTRYEVEVTDNSGCHAYDYVTLTLRDSVLKAAISGPELACPNDIVLFRDTSIGQITNWEWNFGNGVTSDMQNPGQQHFPVVNDTYFTVTLAVTDTAGCVQTAKKIIRSVNNCFIAVPTAFTPNNDGLNDFLYPLNAYKATHLVFKVFNRWGQLVFATTDWTKKWDGKIGGVPQATDVYMWMLSYIDEKQQPVFLKGTTTLIR
jgi:gliding motility-associated-like protein